MHTQREKIRQAERILETPKEELQKEHNTKLKEKVSKQPYHRCLSDRSALDGSQRAGPASGCQQPRP